MSVAPQWRLITIEELYITYLIHRSTWSPSVNCGCTTAQVGLWPVGTIVRSIMLTPLGGGTRMSNRKLLLTLFTPLPVTSNLKTALLLWLPDGTVQGSLTM